MLLQPPVSSGFGLNQVCNFIFNSFPWISLPGTSSVNACRLLGSKALCRKTKVFTIQLYSVWRITSGSKAVLVNYAVSGWKCFFVYTQKYNSPLTLSWFLEDHHFLHMDGSMTAMSLPLSLPERFQCTVKNEVSRLIQTVDAYLDNPAWISNLSEFLSRYMGSHLGLLLHKKEKDMGQVSVSKLVSWNEDFSFDYKWFWMGFIPQILKGIWGWHSQHPQIFKSVSPELTLQMEVPTFPVQQQLILLDFRKLGKS